MKFVEPMVLPVCTRSPVCNSDIVTDFPFLRFNLAEDGKQSPSDDGAGVRAGAGAAVVWAGVGGCAVGGSGVVKFIPSLSQ